MFLCAEVPPEATAAMPTVPPVQSMIPNEISQKIWADIMHMNMLKMNT